MGINAKNSLRVGPYLAATKKAGTRPARAGHVPAFTDNSDQAASFFLIASITASLEVALTVSSMPSLS